MPVKAAGKHYLLKNFAKYNNKSSIILVPQISKGTLLSHETRLQNQFQPLSDYSPPKINWLKSIERIFLFEKVKTNSYET